MNPERFKRLKDIFIAFQELDPAERALYLDKACRGDKELRAEAEKLLSGIDEAEGFLESPALVPTAFDEDDEPQPGTRLGSFRLGRLIVSDAALCEYEAEEDAGARDLTIKLFRPGVVPETTLERFESAASKVAALSHPRLSRVVDWGILETGNRPYLVTESVMDALPITEYARLTNLPVGQRLSLFTDACRAIAHAHDHGVLHRDLQPATILVDVNGKVTVVNCGTMLCSDLDLSLAAILAEVGPPDDAMRHRSPEQRRAERSMLDERTDVYSLGAVLLDLIGGDAPGIESIACAAMNGERSRRHQSVAALIDDLARYQGANVTGSGPAGFLAGIGQRIARLWPFGSGRV